MSSRSANVDRLSLLPDVLLAHILSSMPTKSAVETSILSKRWKSCWTLVHSFDFHYIDHIPDSDTFLSFVDRVLKLCKTSQVKLFRLHCSESLIGNTNVPKWINEAVKLNLKSMKFISFKRRECDIKLIEYLLANANVLKTLTIISEIWPPPDEMRLCEQFMKFPSALGCCEIQFIRKWSHFYNKLDD
ncbi:unnamed protein product [Lactuca saligna]|uniref:F-box domain-containing protein n=1 Tax=Lactuca saligna TaxID=75948 RepID=A0AA36E1L8_LACSI|nr:unnamed protein product [Lactuca saligna]